MIELFFIIGALTCTWCTFWLTRNCKGSALYRHTPKAKKIGDCAGGAKLRKKR